MSGGALTPLDGPLTNRSKRAVFLCFHSIHPDGPPFLSIPPPVFEQQIRLLRRRGFASGRVSDLDRLAHGESTRPLAFITFDDGFRDTAEIALPILLRNGFKPIVFILPELIDAGRLDWPEVADAGRRYPRVMAPLTWEQVRAMADAGVEFGAHSMTHRSLPELDDGALGRELGDSRRIVAEKTGTCDVLAYPFGHWDLRVAMAAVGAGFRYAFTLRTAARGRSTRMSIPRLAVDHRDDPERFGTKLMPLTRGLLLSPRMRQLEWLVRRNRRRPVAADGVGAAPPPAAS